MRKLAALSALALVALPAQPSLAGAEAPSVSAPQVYSTSYLGAVTVKPTQLFRIAPGGADQGDASGPQDRSFDIQVSRTPVRAARPRPWTDRVDHSTDRRLRVRLAAGEITCVRVRQHGWGATSGWSERRCAVRALDDRQAAADGPIRRVRDHRYADGRATYLPAGSALRVAKVPKRAWYGAVYTAFPTSSPHHCVGPDLRLVGKGRPHGYKGGGNGDLEYRYSTARRAGTAVIESRTGPTCHIGGAVIVPAWAR
ncbi:hypothetical protein [Nocardioides mangrovi]|uniref:Secreted protein n=1 Tax=Nocardioides mangrovi TaxID=2874580 RepID=A0ABS7UDB5_9ACTN|nr:hypothetical protein [Nocardioides mangrovi]MBZ5738993.1 hypothetical protein [Nocardioides mangrovi]